MRTKRRGLLGVLFALALAVGLLPGMALTAYAVDPDLPILDIGAYSYDGTEPASGEGWSYAPATDTTPATLTLNGATITGALPSDPGIHSLGISQLDIVLSSKSTVGDETLLYGILSTGSVTISGDGSLECTGKLGGISATGDVEITGGEVTASSNGQGIRSGGKINISGGKVTASGYLNGICVGEGQNGPVDISGGEVIATGGESDRSYGIAGTARITGGVVIASGANSAISSFTNTIKGRGWESKAGEGAGTVINEASTAQSPGYKKIQFPATLYDVWVGGTRVTSANASNVDGEGKVSYDPAKGTLALNGYNNNDAVYTWGYNNLYSAAIYAKQDLTIAHTGTNTLTNSISGPASSYVVEVEGNLTIDGKGTLNAKGAYHGIQATGDTITINGGTVNASGAGDNWGVGIYASRGGVAINGGNVTAEGKNYGIFASNDAVINAGSVTATSDYNCGICASQGGVTINGGNVTAEGKDYGIKANNVSIEGDVVTATGGKSAISGSVKNSIEGIGWTDTAGTKDKTGIAISAEGQTLDKYKKVLFAKPATVTTKPAAKTLTYTGSAQELVTAGKADGGTMQYALGEDAKTAPASGWSTSIPTGTDAKAYYVWYKAVGDESHLDSDPDCISASISKADISKATVTLDPASYTYDGKAKEPAAKVMLGGRTLAAGTDYTVSYKDNTNVGTATATVAGKGNYAGSATATFTIEAAPGPEPTPPPAAKTSIAKAKVALSKKTVAYTGKALKPKVKSVTLNGKKLNPKTDYDVKYANNVKLGAATVTVTGKGDYKDSAKATFSIRLGKAKLTIAAQSKAKAMKAEWTKVAGAKSYQLQWRERGGKWKSATAKSTESVVKGMEPGKLYDLRVRAVAGKAKGAWSSQKHRWYKGQAGVRAASKKAGAVKAAWSENAKADAGYKVVVRYSKYGKAVATKVVAAGETSATITGLKAGNTAWVQVKALRSAGDATYSGILTRAKPVKVAGKAAKAQSADQQAKPQAAGSGLVAAAL